MHTARSGSPLVRLTPSSGTGTGQARFRPPVSMHCRREAQSGSADGCRLDAANSVKGRESMKRTVQEGLTIIELMIIVAIIGILASVAIPAWQDYTVREKVREAVDLANPARAALGIACSKGTLSGADNQSLGLSPGHAYSGDHTRNVAAAGVSSTEGIVTVTLRSIGGVIDDGQQIVYTGACGTGGMRWMVGGDVSPKYLPES